MKLYVFKFLFLFFVFINNYICQKQWYFGVTQLVYPMFISKNYPFFSLMAKAKFCKITKSLKILSNWFSSKFYFLFMFLLTTIFVKNSHILARIFFIFLKNVLKQTWISFNTKYQLQWKDQKSSHHVKVI